MILEYATKRNASGNRSYLGIDTEKKVFSRERGYWFCREDVIEISKADRIRLIEKLEKESYTEIEYFNRRNKK